jgi:hypothetical protein
MYMLVV